MKDKNATIKELDLRPGLVHKMPLSESFEDKFMRVYHEGIIRLAKTGRLIIPKISKETVPEEFIREHNERIRKAAGFDVADK
jgi:hypothetical protein